MTNRDRLRNMTDEELAEFICYTGGDCNYCQLYKYCKLDDCENVILNWLKKEAKA